MNTNPGTASLNTLSTQETPPGRWDVKLQLGIALVVLLILGLGVRLFFLQVLHGEDYTVASMEGIVKKKTWIGARGEIRDQKGRFLVKNTANPCIYANPAKVLNPVKVLESNPIDSLCQQIQLSAQDCESIRTKIAAVAPERRDKEILVLDGLTKENMALFESNASTLQGFRLKVQARRLYMDDTPAKLVGAEVDPCVRGRRENESYKEYIQGQPRICSHSHLLGFVNQPSAEEIDAGYSLESLVGRSGVEKAMEEQLRGHDGYEWYIGVPGKSKKLDVAFLAMLENQLIEGDRKKESIPGNHVYLTIDSSFQQSVYEAISSAAYPAAAAAVVEVGTGRILALVSRPGFYTTYKQSLGWEKWMLDHPHQPLKDRTLRETYFPASTFKLITAVAAFQQRENKSLVLDPDLPIHCNGAYYMRGQRFGDHEHGKVNFHQALVRSCNVYFFQLAEQLGLDTIAQTAGQFGIGLPLGLHLGESKGIMPTKQYFIEDHPDHMYRPGNALNAAIGQGEVKTTVLHMAMAYEAFVNGGSLHEPILVDRVETPTGDLVFSASPHVRNIISIPKEAQERIMRAFYQVVHAPKGTAHKALIGDHPDKTIPLAGKTGTVQLGKKNAKSTQQDHSWFVGFSPTAKPEVVIAVFVEHGGNGGETAAPLVYKIQQRYAAWKHGTGERKSP